MGKKLKGKQKQDEKPAGGRGESHPLPSEPMHQSPMSTEAMMYQNEPVPQESTWGIGGGGGGGTWGTTAHNNPAMGDTWGVPGSTRHHQGPDDSWGHAESLLQPPPSHAPSVLTTIPEQPPSNQYIQNRTALSDIGESNDEYSEGGWGGHGSRSPHQWAGEGPQSRTLTATAAPSAMASPVGPPPVSLAEAAEAAQRERDKQRTSASEAARRMEESRRHSIETHHMAHSEAMRPSAHAVHTAATHKPTSSASAAAAALAASMPHYRGAQPPPSESGAPSINGKTSWIHPKPFMPNNDRQPARIPVDPSWIHTGGNAWSNKGLGGKKVAPAVNWAQPVETSWGVPRQSFHPPPPPPQPQASQHSSHRKHHSTGHTSQRVHHQRESENHQSWQGWGKGSWGASQGPQTEIEDDEETVEGDEWGQTGGDSWGGAWGQPPPSIHGNQGKGNPKSERGRGHRRKSDPAESWGSGEGDWPAQTGQAVAWGQTGGDDFKAPSRNWGEQAANDSWGPAANHDSGWGGDNFDHQSKVAPAWGQPEKKRTGGGGGGGWGQEKFGSGGGWGQEIGAEGGAGGQEKPSTTWGQPQDSSAWDQGALGSDAWGNTNADNGAPAAARWGSPANDEWGTKVAPPTEVVGGSRNALSPQQRSQILNSLLNQTHTQNLNAPAQANIKQPHGQGPTTAMAMTMKQDNWGAWNAGDAGSDWGTDEEDEDEEAGETRKVRFSPKASDLWGGSPRSVPSKSLAAQAQQGITTTIINDASYVRFVESSGAGLAFVSNALFGNGRLARERLHWLFPSNKDQRVAGMLAWVQKMSFNLGTYGLLKFLENRERGGLFVNAAFRMRQHPQEPAFDFLTFDQLQATMDKTLQESVAFYDPSEFAMVFIFLPSQTGNSLAIWRRKINVPDSARRKYRPEIEAIKRTLRPAKEYVVMVDELPKTPQVAPPVPGKPGQLRKSGTLLKSNTLTKKDKHMSDPASKKKKKKWWKLFLN